MRSDIEMCRELDVAAVVLGVLQPNGDVDEQRTAELMRLAAPMDVTFHRALDMTRDLRAAAEALLRLGVKRVLTSGGESDCIKGQAAIKVERQAQSMHGAESSLERTARCKSDRMLWLAMASPALLFLQALVSEFGDRLTILAGGGLTPDNIPSFAAHTGVCEVHASLRGDWQWGRMQWRKSGVFMGGEKRNDGPHVEYAIKTADESKIRAVTGSCAVKHADER